MTAPSNTPEDIFFDNCRYPKPLVSTSTDWLDVVDKLRTGLPCWGDVELLLEEGCSGSPLPLFDPISVASAISEYEFSQLNKMGPLRIAILGTSLHNDRTEGRLYSLLPTLLSRSNLKVEVELVSHRGSSTLPNFALEFETLPRPALRHTGKFGSWWKSRRKAQHLPDVLIAVQPGLEEFSDQWMNRNEIPTILKSGIPMIVLSYDLDEAERDVRILTSFGAHVISPPRLLPVAANDNPNSTQIKVVSTAGAMFKIAGFTPQSVPRAKQVTRQVHRLAAAVAHVFLQNRTLVKHADTFRPCILTARGTRMEVLHIISNLYFDPLKVEIFIGEEGDGSPILPPLPAPNVALRLAASENDLDRAILAAEIYSWYCEPWF